MGRVTVDAVSKVAVPFSSVSMRVRGLGVGRVNVGESLSWLSISCCRKVKNGMFDYNIKLFEPVLSQGLPVLCPKRFHYNYL